MVTVVDLSLQVPAVSDNTPTILRLVAGESREIDALSKISAITSTEGSCGSCTRISTRSAAAEEVLVSTMPRTVRHRETNRLLREVQLGRQKTSG